MKQTLVFASRPRIAAHASLAGPKEGQGPLGARFDELLEDDLLGQPSWELAEAEMVRRVCGLCLRRAGVEREGLEAHLGGDLLNQLMASGIAARDLGAPFLGLYGACSTMAEGMLLAAALVDGGYRANALACASSHFCTAERQFRFPLELGMQKPPSAQRTATAAGAVLLRREGGSIAVEAGTIGRIVDFAITDANHMGAAMAPAVADTIETHFADMQRTHAEYDLIVTGDLGKIGREILLELFRERGIDMPEEKLMDCGASMFAPEQDCHSGASGCGCIASVLTGHILRKMEEGELRRVLAVGSGAMTSTTSAQQGLSIPSVAHAVALAAEGK